MAETVPARGQKQEGKARSGSHAICSLKINQYLLSGPRESSIYWPRIKPNTSKKSKKEDIETNKKRLPHSVSVQTPRFVCESKLRGGQSVCVVHPSVQIV